MIKNIGFVLAGIIGATAVPSIASTVSNSTDLTESQIEFIKQVDSETGSKFTNLLNTPGANTIIKTATVACGNVEFQKQFMFSAGGNEKDAEYASNKFETLFCNNNQ